MMKYILGSFLVAAVVAGGAFFYLQEPQPGPVTATITYNDDGYSPSEVTIKKGEAVRWVNESKTNQGTWPASAIHPTHSLYPEKKKSDCLGSSFDACRDVWPGESWEFTFRESGSWKFHDHVHPSKMGTVHVE